MFVDVPSRMLLLVIFGLSAERALGAARLPPNDIAVFTEGLRMPALLTTVGLTSSNSETNRKLKKCAVRIDTVVAYDPQRVFTAGFEGVLQVAKRNFARVRLVNA